MSAVAAAGAGAVGEGRRGSTWVGRLLRSGKGRIGCACLFLLVVVAVLPAQLAPQSPTRPNPRVQLKAPSETNLLGTDELGRDILSRIIWGTPVAVQAGLLAVAIAATVGALTGLAAGYLGGWFDATVMRLWDTLLAFPAIFLAIGIVTVLGPGWLNAVLAIAAINVPTFSRLVRAATLSIKGKEFVEAARSLGATDARIMSRTILPNCMAALVVQAAIAVPEAILVEASLSYLGLGSQPPAPSWGNMLSAAQAYLFQAPTYGVFPGLAITFVVLGLSFFADGLQNALDPRRVNAR